MKEKKKLREVDVSRAESTPVQNIRRGSEEHRFLGFLLPFVELRASKTNLAPLEIPYQERFVELSLANTEQLVNDKFDQMYEDEEQFPEYALTEGTPARESGNNMNVEPTAQSQIKTPITFKSKPKYFSNDKGWKNYFNGWINIERHW